MMTSTGASARLVNRVHRVVRDEALKMHTDREQKRSLLAPVAICSALLLVALYAAWTMLSWYRATPSGIPDAGDQLMLVLLWCLPMTVAALVFVLYRRRSAES
jgi:hypothetical protein